MDSLDLHAPRRTRRSRACGATTAAGRTRSTTASTLRREASCELARAVSRRRRAGASPSALSRALPSGVLCSCLSPQSARGTSRCSMWMRSCASRAIHVATCKCARAGRRPRLPVHDRMSAHAKSTWAARSDVSADGWGSYGMRCGVPMATGSHTRCHVPVARNPTSEGVRYWGLVSCR